MTLNNNSIGEKRELLFSPVLNMATSTGVDPEARFFAQSTFDLLLIELVPMAQRIASQIHAADQLAIHGSHVPAPAVEEDDDHLREAVYYRLERLGYRVGLGLVER